MSIQLWAENSEKIYPELRHIHLWLYSDANPKRKMAFVTNHKCCRNRNQGSFFSLFVAGFLSRIFSVHTSLQCHEDIECTRFPVGCPHECGEEEIPREEVNI